MLLADWGQQEFKLAEAEMPVRIALREEYGASKPFSRCTHRRLLANDYPNGGID